MPPGNSQKILDLREASDEGELPYISKSRLKTWLECQKKFAYKYILGIRTPGNYHTRKGTALHTTFEVFYKNCREWVDKHGTYPPLYHMIPDELHHYWGNFTTPHIRNFLDFEATRVQMSDSPEEWLPVAVEDEVWLDDPPVDGSPPWQGFIDTVWNSSTVPGAVDNGGVVIGDWKTGKTPDEEYREEGIYTQQEYYGMVADKKYDVDGIAGVFPQNNDVLIVEPTEDRREFIKAEVAKMIELDGVQDADRDEQPLCYYGHGSCHFHSENQGVNPLAADELSGECKSRWGLAGGPGPTY